MHPSGAIADYQNLIEYNLTMNSNFIQTKQNYEWHLIRNYLEGIYRYQEIKKDDKFIKLFKELFAYVESKLELPANGDIVDLYVTVIQEP